MTFQWPLLLLSLALVPVLVGLYALAQKRRRRYAVRFTNLALLSEVAPKRPGARRHLPPLLFLLGLAALLVSLARPTAVVAVPRDQTAVVMVLDVSGSMAAQDLAPNRMVAAKNAARAFMDAMPRGAQVGLVTFNNAARVSTPLTHEADDVRESVDRLFAGGGTAIGDGLNLALDELDRRPAPAEGEKAPALVVLLSDGQSTAGAAPDQAAARAVEAGVPVHTVGIGDRDEAPMVAGPGGRQQAVPLDEATLQQVAQETGGTYYYAAEADRLEEIYEELGSQVAWVEERTEITAAFSALGGILLTLGGLLGLRWFGHLP